MLWEQGGEKTDGGGGGRGGLASKVTAAAPLAGVTQGFFFAMWGNVWGTRAGGRRLQITLADVPKRPSAGAPGRQAWARRFGTRDMVIGFRQGPARRPRQGQPARARAPPKPRLGPGPCPGRGAGFRGSILRLGGLGFTMRLLNLRI